MCLFVHLFTIHVIKQISLRPFIKHYFIGRILSDSSVAPPFLLMNKLPIYYGSLRLNNKKKDNTDTDCFFPYSLAFHTVEIHRLAYEGKGKWITSQTTLGELLGGPAH